MRALALVIGLSLAGLGCAWWLRRSAGGRTRPGPQRRALLGPVLAALALLVPFALRSRAPFDVAATRAGTAAWMVGSLALGALCAFAAQRIGPPEDETSNARASHGVRARAAAVFFASAISALALAYLVGLVVLAHPVHEDALVGVPLLLLAFSLGQALVYALAGGGVLDALVLESAPCMLLAASLAQDNAERIPMAEPIPTVLLLPLVARALGLLAAAAGVLSLREDDEERTSLVRGALVAALVAAVGIGAAARWALGPEHVLLLYCCVLVGVGAALALVLVGPRFAFLPVAIALAAAMAAYALGTRSGLMGGGAFAISVALSSAMGLSGYALALEGAASGGAPARAYANGTTALSSCVALAALLVVFDTQACGAWVRDLRLPDAVWGPAFAHCHEVGPVFARAEVGTPAAALGACLGAALAYRLARMSVRAPRPVWPTLLTLIVPGIGVLVFAVLRGEGAITLAALLAVGAAAVTGSLAALGRDDAAAASTLRSMLVLLVSAALATAPLL